MVVESLLALDGEFLGDVEVGVLGRLDQVGVDLEGEGAEALVVDAPAGEDVLADVLAEGLDDEVELGLGVEGLDGLGGAGLGGLVLAGVVLGVGGDPAWRGRYQL